MKKQIVFLISLAIVLIGCNLSSETFLVVSQTATPEFTSEQIATKVAIQTLIDAQMVATPIPVPEDPKLGGFWYHEDGYPAPGLDPVFAVCNGKAVKLTQTGESWDIVPITIEELSNISLNATAQRSDFMRYIYIPSIGEIHLVDSRGIQELMVTNFNSEYDPEYWVWAWTSLMFIKHCQLRIFRIDELGGDQLITYDMR